MRNGGSSLLARSFIHRIRRSFSSDSGVSNALVLGIETSCDDTGIAIVNETGRVVGDAHHSQLATHLSMGGIIPPVAQSLHRRHIADVHKKALEAASMKPNDLDAVAVTTRPGLGLSLQVGLDHAKQFCREFSLPMIPVHHMEAHALVVRSCLDVKFPFMVLLVSGGHCQIAVVRDVSDFILLGCTTDDAPGEAFDKIARRLKLNNIDEFRNLSGGAAIEHLARNGDPLALVLPPPMTRHRNCDFSFSGLKTSVFTEIRRNEKQFGIEGNALLPNIPDICASVQHCVYLHLLKRMQRAFTFCRRTELDFGDRLVISGGVACSSYLRFLMNQLCDYVEVEMFVPPPKLCSDNGIMIAWNGIEHLKKGGSLVSPEDLDSVHFQARCPLGVDRRYDVAKEGIPSERFKIDMDRLMKDTGNEKWRLRCASNAS